MPTRLQWFAPSSLRALALFAALLATSARAGLFTADSTYMGYRIPEHRWSYWKASVYSNGNQSDVASFAGRSRYGSLSGYLETRAAFVHDADHLQHQWNFLVSGSGGRGHQDRTEEFFSRTYRSDYSDRSLQERFQLGGSLRHYPGRGLLGVTLATFHSLDLGQSFSKDRFSGTFSSYRDVSDDARSDGSRDYRGSVDYWVGLGHVRDATPVHRVQSMEERLLRSNVLKAPLSARSRNRLAELFAAQKGFGAAHERPDRYFWREIERVLREEEGVEVLDAWSLLRLLEPITAGAAVVRQAGFFVGPAVSVSTLRRHSVREESRTELYYYPDTVYVAYESSLSRTDNQREDDVSSGLQAEFHRPAGPRWQFGAFTSLAVHERGRFPNITSSLGIAWILSDRWLATMRANQSAFAGGRGWHVDRWDVRVNADLAYFLEDSWALFLSGREQQADVGSFNRSRGFSFGVAWIVSGFFEAPGLVPAMRPSPPVP